MAKKKKKKSSKKKGTTCKVVSPGKRKICWGSNGIVSNKPASGSSKRSSKKAAKKASKKASKKRIPMSQRTGPKVTRGGKKVCKFGVNKNTGNCLKAKRKRK